MEPISEASLRRIAQNALKSTVAQELIISNADMKDLVTVLVDDWRVVFGFPLGYSYLDRGKVVDRIDDKKALFEQLKELAKKSPDLQGLMEDFRYRAPKSKNEEEGKRKEWGEGSVDFQESSEQAEETKESETPILDALDAGSRADRTRALLIRMHMGKAVMPGQPRHWIQRGDALSPPMRDYINYHGQNKKPGCPTCKHLARFFRIPGGSSEVISTLINWYTTREGS